MISRPNALAVALMVLATAVSSCSRRPPSAPETAVASSPARETPPVSPDVEDAPELRAVPQRIVSLAPSHTETLFAIGAGDRVVGVTDLCNYPPEAAKLPRASEFSKVNVEAVIALEPDLVLAAHGNPGDEIQQIKDLGVPVYGIDPKTYDEAVEAIEALGALVGEEESAHRVAEELRRAKAEVAVRVADLPPGGRPVVLICPMPPLELPLWVPGQHTYHDDMIRAVGGRNVVPEGLDDWQPMGLESLVKAEPDIIIGPCPEGRDPTEERERLERDLRRIDGFATMPALKTGRVCVMPEDPLFRPGPRLGDTIRQLARIVHPELFAGEDTP